MLDIFNVTNIASFYIKGFEFGLLIGFIAFLLTYGISYSAKLIKNII